MVNAVAHRDYGDQGRNIEVWFYEDRMEVTSPGDLVPPVTLADLRSRRSVHASRNPLIVRVLVETGIMREEGEGIPRIFEEADYRGLFGVTREAALQELRRLSEEGYLKQEGERRASRYVPGPSLFGAGKL